MNIALVGYGKMGKAIEKIALKRNHKILFKKNFLPDKKIFKEIDVAIEFSTPSSAFENIKFCINNNIPVVSGTTGWDKDINYIKKLCKEKNGSFVYSSNFSIGVNILFEINNQLSKLLFPYKEYIPEINEIHHLEKKDTPSGTSINLAEIIIKNKISKEWVTKNKNKKNQLLIRSKRIDNIIGKHIIKYSSYIDDIILIHEAKNRNGFALGAIIASEWIINKNGFFSMKDVLDINIKN